MKTIKEVCRHEAGHYVVGRCLGFRTDFISIRLLDVHGGHGAEAAVTLPQPITTLETLLKYAEDRIQMLFAGSLAQNPAYLHCDNANAADILQNKGGKSDFDKAVELIHVIRNIRYATDVTDSEAQDHIKLINRDLWRRAIEIVKKEAKVIEAVSRVLAAKVTAIGVRYQIDAGEINGIPEVIARFSSLP